MWDFILLTSAPAFASDGKNTRQRFPVLEWAAGIFTRHLPSSVFTGYSFASLGITAPKMPLKRDIFGEELDRTDF